MTAAEKIVEEVKSLSREEQEEVLDGVLRLVNGAEDITDDDLSATTARAWAIIDGESDE